MKTNFALSLSIAALTCLQLFAIAQGTKTGNPEKNLPFKHRAADRLR